MKEVLFTDKYDSQKEIYIENSIIFAKGGDGTLLRAIAHYKHLNLPFYGIAKGTVNFLMNDFKKINISLAKVKTFNLIKVKVLYKEDFYYYKDGFKQVKKVQKEKKYQAFNEIMLGGTMNSWIDFEVKEKDNIIPNFKGGGMIISTAQGSTGINKNNKGVILPLSSNCWSVTGDKTNKNINFVLEPHKTEITVNSRTGVTLWVDGSNKVIQSVEKIILTKGKEVKVMFNEYNNFKTKRGQV